MTKQIVKIEFTPWEEGTESPSVIHPLEYQNSPKKVQLTLAPLNTKGSLEDNNPQHIKKHNRYLKVLPRVYDKKINQSQQYKNKEIHQAKVEVSLKPVSKNDFIINVPQDPSQLPKVQLQHPIKHSMKTLKHINHKSDHNLHKKTQVQEYQCFRHKIRKSSIDLTHDNKNHANILKKLSDYEQQVIKKCSLKNLQIYEQRNGRVDQKVKYTCIRKQERMPKFDTKSQKKHILDRILSRLE